MAAGSSSTVAKRHGAAGIREVARLAGVSTATVSRVLGNGTVSQALREQVERAIRRTGYRPNLSARRLRSAKSGTIGLIVADLRNPFFTEVGHAVEDAAYRRGLRVILCNTDEDPAREALYLRLMQEERVTGIVFAPTRRTLEREDRFPPEIPMVLIDRAAPGGLHDAVVLDNHAASRELVAHLHAQGCRRIAGLFGTTSSTGAERQAGFLEALAAHGLPPLTRWVMPYAEAGEAAARLLLQEAPAPDAIVVSNGRLLMGALRAVRARGLAMPDQLALAGFDDEDWTGLVEPGLTVIAQPVGQIGAAAMALLFERLDDPGRSPRQLVLAGRCIVRGSTLRTGG